MYIRVDPSELRRTCDLLGDAARTLVDAGSGVREGCCCTAPASLAAYLESEGGQCERELSAVSEGLWWESHDLAVRTAPVTQSLPTAASAAWGTGSGDGFSGDPTGGWLPGVSGDGTPGAPFGGGTGGWLPGVSGDGTPGAPFGGGTGGWLPGVSGDGTSGAPFGGGTGGWLPGVGGDGAPQGTYPIPATGPWMTGIGVGTAPSAGVPYMPGVSGTSTSGTSIIGGPLDPFGNELVNGVLRGLGATPVYGGIGATYQPTAPGPLNLGPIGGTVEPHETGTILGG